jgi:hypothetical protein
VFNKKFECSGKQAHRQLIVIKGKTNVTVEVKIARWHPEKDELEDRR